jgi:hypothetical protein
MRGAPARRRSAQGSGRRPARPLVAWAAVALVLSWAVPGPARAEILLGIAGPLTGPNAWLGDLTVQGVEMALADLNAAGVLGEPVRAVSTDDFGDPDQGRAAARKLVADGVAAVIGRLGFDAKGDVTGIETFRWYRWHQGELVPEEVPAVPSAPGRWPVSFTSGTAWYLSRMVPPYAAEGVATPLTGGRRATPSPPAGPAGGTPR